MYQSTRSGGGQSSVRSSANPADQRVAPRHTLLIRTAKLVVAGHEYLCLLRDASETGVAVRLFHPLAPERVMKLELQNEERHEVELVWQEGDRMGLRFREPVDVHRLIEMPAPHNRRPIRVRLNVPGVITAGEDTVMCALLDLSQHGAKVACDRLFAIDQRVRFVAAGMPKVQGKVRWRRNNELGLAFETTFQLAEFAAIVAGFHGQRHTRPAMHSAPAA